MDFITSSYLRVGQSALSLLRGLLQAEDIIGLLLLRIEYLLAESGGSERQGEYDLIEGKWIHAAGSEDCHETAASTEFKDRSN